MPKFAYYIVNTEDASLTGTDDESVAQQFAGNTENFVIDAENGEHLAAEIEVVRVEIEEAILPNEAE